MREIVQLLQIPYDVTVAYQYKRLTLSDVFGRWLGMQLHLDMLCKKKSLKTDLAKQLLNALTIRNENIFKNPIMGAALYLDPRFRSQIIRDDGKCNQAKMTLLDIWRRINVVRNNNNRTIDEREISSSSIDSLSFDEEAALIQHLQLNQNEQNVATQNNFQNVDIELLIDLFQPEQLFPKESVIEYWETQKNTQPELYEIAMIVFSVPPTEVQIERDFSSLDFVFSKRRGKLSHQRLEDILLIYLNKDLFNDVNNEDIAALIKTLKPSGMTKLQFK